MKIGVLCLQGGYQKHIEILSELKIKAIKVRYESDLSNIDGLIIPGGESTTFSRLIQKQKLYRPLMNYVKKNPVYATCAGLILLSNSILNNDTIKTFNILDITISKNAWGRQIYSFVKDLEISIFDKKFKGIFIRAPKITRANQDIEILSSIDNSPVMVKKNNLLGTTFHPELTNDTRIHEYFVRMVDNYN